MRFGVYTCRTLVGICTCMSKIDSGIGESRDVCITGGKLVAVWVQPLGKGGEVS